MEFSPGGTHAQPRKKRLQTKKKKVLPLFFYQHRHCCETFFFYRSSHHIPLLSNPPKRGTFFFNPRAYLFQPIPYPPPQKKYNDQATTTAKWKECFPWKTKMTLENHHFQSLEIHHFQIGCCSNSHH